MVDEDRRVGQMQAAKEVEDTMMDQCKSYQVSFSDYQRRSLLNYGIIA